ncbi:MAG: hypothetical protein IC227_05330 [Enterococcus lacertideformus]|uniref:Uncharacterized protein n=1 Tax=Enterococcus lacertideformus TaxID=2771493 RepID=A0A931F9N8_9ENTE|nr:hypothetical protein [Enterococcus lacertideformus]
MRAADLLTLITNSPTKNEYHGVYLSDHDKIQPLTSIKMTENNQCVLFFTDNTKPLSMNELLLFLMKNREKELLYQKEQEIFPLYGLKETNNQLLI